MLMQIPYDLEFVEERSPVRVQAIAVERPFPVWPDRRARRADVFDRLLLWVFQTIRRFESRP
jgi:hypothetical protein